ncbi:MAG TPA: PAS domain S-box protein [Nitrospira sp.]|nr:PAS domain S-box protein [Nitrospira sp.]
MGASVSPARRLSRTSQTRVTVAMALLAAGILLLDVWTPPSLDVPILYMCVVFLALWSPSFLAPVISGATTVVLTALPPLLFSSHGSDWSMLVNRLITCAALLITALLVSARRTADAKLRESQEALESRVQERTAQLQSANEALESEIAVRRAAEQSLSESRERLAGTETFSLVMVTHVGLDGRWLKVPASLCRLLGYSESELLAATFMDVTHPEDVQPDWSQCQRLIRGDIKSFELEKRYVRKDGQLVWVYLNCSGVYDAEGRLLHFLTYIRDISERKRVEQALHESDKKWRSVIETVPIGIAISTMEGAVLDANTAGWRMLGYQSKEEFLRQAAVSHYWDPADRERRIDGLRRGNHVFETLFKKQDGTAFWGRCTAATLSGPRGEVLLINAFEDVTDQRRYRDTLQQTKDELQAANARLMERDEMRTKFISVVSHELRTPMAAIKGFIDNMLNGVTGDLNERQTDYLRRMQASLDRLTRLIGQLLDWSGLESGAVPLVRRSVCPVEVVRRVVDNARAVADAKQVRVMTEIEPGLPTVEADPDKLEQVLWNLVGNAIKFSQPSATVTVECRHAPDEGILYTVTDTGCGIAAADLPRVFDQFSGVQAPIPSARGAQLGLYITKSLVSQHGGRIWVESNPGEGSRFSVCLPGNRSSPTR